MKFFTLLAAPLLVSSSPLLAERQADRSIDTLLKGVGKIYFGAATEKAKLDTGKTGAIVQKNFGQVTNEYLMKWDQTEPSRGQFTLGPANGLVQWAITNGKSIRGHALVWGDESVHVVPQWVLDITNKATLTEVIQTHIKTVMAGPNNAWKGKIRSWDVVNEVIGDDGNLKNTHFLRVLGEDYIGIAFRAARAADPTAKLYINDYNLESNTYGQHQGMMKYVKKWIAEGIPIDGIGSQTHIRLGKVPPRSTSVVLLIMIHRRC
jgi:endo-1,4-beta-xylanase